MLLDRIPCVHRWCQSRLQIWIRREKKRAPSTKRGFLEQHLIRANNQCYIWRHAVQPIFNQPSYVNFCWSLSREGKVVIRWMTLPPAPDSALSSWVVDAKWAVKVNHKHCCRNAGVFCKDMCGCIDCQNSEKDEIRDNMEDRYDSEGCT